jgi:hypothetical protein
MRIIDLYTKAVRLPIKDFWRRWQPEKNLSAFVNSQLPQFRIAYRPE